MKNDDEKQFQTTMELNHSLSLDRELKTLRSRLRWAQESQDLAVRILALLNRRVVGLDAIREILGMVKEFTGFEAVGIRLRDGEDFPYFETRGFPAHFVEAENFLCGRTHNGEIMRDSAGNPVLDCMCGNIIQGRTNPSFPFFSEGGSFWSNSTTELLATTSEEDRQARTRNRCNGEGYESVALIPLRSNHDIIGLLQLNDSRKNCFTLDMIGFLEGIGASIGVVLERKQSEEALEKARNELERRVEDRTAALREVNGKLDLEISERNRAEEQIKRVKEALNTVVDNLPIAVFAKSAQDGQFILWNKASESLFGFNKGQVIGKTDDDFFPKEQADFFWEKDRETFASGEIVDIPEEPILSKSLGTRILHTRKVPVYDSERQPFYLLAISQDITERKQAEQALQTSEERYRTLVENIGVGISLIDSEHNVIVTNSIVGKWFDKPASEFSGKKCFQEFEKRDAVCEHCPGVRAMASGQPAEAETEGVRDDGTRIVVRIRAFPMFGPDGVATGFTEVIEDITERREGEEALRESEQRFRAVFENDHVLMLIVDPDTGRIVDASPGACAFYGYDREELKGKELSEINILSPVQLHQRMQEAKFKQRRYFDFQHRLASGEIRDVEACTGPISIGGRTLLFSVVNDVTERNRAEQAIRESEARVRLKLDSILSPEGDLGILELAVVIDAQIIQALMDDFFSLTKIGVGIVDLEGKILVATGWQEICTRFHRVHPETGKYCLESDTQLSDGLEQGSFKLYRCKNNMWDIATPIILGGRHLGNLFLGQFLFEDESPDYEVFRSQARQYGFDEEQYLSALERVPRWSRETVDTAMAFYAKLASILSTQSYSNIKLARSLAEKERLGNSLRESEQRYRALFDESRDGVWLNARDGALIDANEAFLDLFGLTREESKHWNFIKAYRDPADRKRFQETIERNGSVGDYDLKLKKKDGTEIDCQLTATLRLDEEGKVLGYQGIIRDMTERKKLEQQLLQAQKMEAIGTLAGGIAHDFNNLLTVILGYSELIVSEKNEGDRDYEDLKKVIHAGRSAADMVQQILAFSRKTETKFWPINLNKQVPQLRKMLSRLIPRTIEVQIDLDPDLPTVNADPAQIDQILMNLAVNARDAMPNGGRLAIETKAVMLDEEYCITHIEASKGPHALITVSDTGTGIDRATSDRIFEPFYTTKKPGQGTGLGLSMVYGIVKGHGGHITVHSELGAGTAFRIYIPAHQVVAELDVAASGQFAALGTGTILLADDEELVRSLGERILSKAGYKILTAINGREALEIYQQKREKISLVILDLIMPVMDGKQCLDEILKVNPQAKVLIASGYSPDGATKESLDGRAKGLVKKPYDIKQLVQSVREALDSHGATVRAKQ